MEQPQIKKTIRSSVQRLKRHWVILLNVSLGFILLSHYCKHQQDQTAKRFVGYKAVVRSLQVGDLRPDANGLIKLPPHLRWLTRDGNVYQSPDQTPGKVWLFPTAVSGRLVSGYIFTVKPGEDSWFPFDNIDDVYIRDGKIEAGHWQYAVPYAILFPY